MIIHEKGWKAERDRKAALTQYDALTKYFKIKRLTDVEIAELSNKKLYKICEDMYNRQSRRSQIKYAEHIGSYREKPKAFKWFFRDYMKLKAPGNIFSILFIAVQLPFRYPGFVKRFDAATKKKQEETEKKIVTFPETDKIQ